MTKTSAKTRVLCTSTLRGSITVTRFTAEVFFRERMKCKWADLYIISIIHLYIYDMMCVWVCLSLCIFIRSHTYINIQTRRSMVHRKHVKICAWRLFKVKYYRMQVRVRKDNSVSKRSWTRRIIINTFILGTGII